MAPRKTPTISAAPFDDELDNAFSDGRSFTETMTGIAALVGESISDATDALKSSTKDAAATPPADGAGGNTSLLRNPKLLAAVGGFVVLAAGAAWLFSGTAGNDNAKTVAGSPAASPAVIESDLLLPSSRGPEPAAQAAYVALLEEARLARDSGQLIAPRGDSAVELYVAARDAAPDDATIAAEIDELIDQVFGLAESALLDQRSSDAAAAVAMARFAMPDNPRLAFLDAQLVQMQLRQALDQARAAIRENRFEDAAVSLRQAETVAGNDMTEIDLLAEELAAARSKERVEDVLALAGQRLDDNLLTSPSNDNARYYYELALGNDPENTAARQGLVIVAGKLALRAREAIDGGNFAAAEGLLKDARALDPASEELAASTRALGSAREAQAEQQAQAARQAELERRAAAEREQQRLADEREAQRLADEREAQRLADELEAERQTAARAALVAGAAAVSAGAGAGPAADEGLAANRTASTSDAADATTAVSDDSAGTGTNSNSTTNTTLLAAAAAARTTLDLDAGMTPQAGFAATGSSASTAPTSPQAVGISVLTRTNYASPKYPRSAMRRNITGSVDVSFTVGLDGQVYDVKIINSTPGKVFDQAAIDAVEQWQFEPVIENGQAVEKRSAVRMAFDLQ